MKYGNRSPSYIKRITNSPITLVFILVLCFFLAKATWNVDRKAFVTKTKLLQARTEMTTLEDRQNILVAKVATLSTEEGLESEMRTKYRAVREGEFVAVIVDNKTTSAAATTTSAIQTGWWDRLMRLMGIKS